MARARKRTTATRPTATRPTATRPTAKRARAQRKRSSSAGSAEPSATPKARGRATRPKVPPKRQSATKAKAKAKPKAKVKQKLKPKFKAHPKPKVKAKPSKQQPSSARPRKPPRIPKRSPKRPPRRSPKPAPKPAPKQPRRPSRSPAAIRARKRRIERRGIREQLRAEAAGLAPAQGGDERRLAWGWHELIRDRIREDAFDVDLDLTEAGGGHADLEGRQATTAQRTLWLSVGRYTPRDELDYATLAHGLRAVADDLILEAAIHPQRLSQIRVEFHDPDDTRGAGDAVLSKIGPWEFVISDLVGELVGASWESPTDGSLAARYEQTIVPRFYIFFAGEIVRPKATINWATVTKRKPR